MSYPTSFRTLSRSSSQIRNNLLHDYKPFEPWCLLLNESQPDVSMVQVPLMNPETCTNELVCLLLCGYSSLAILMMHIWEAIPSCSCMGPERSKPTCKYPFEYILSCVDFLLVGDFVTYRGVIVRCDFQRVFATVYFALLPNFELLKAIHNDIVAHRRLPYARRPKWAEVRPQ